MAFLTISQTALPLEQRNVSCLPYPPAMWQAEPEANKWCSLNKEKDEIRQLSFDDSTLSLHDVLTADSDGCVSRCQQQIVLNKLNLYQDYFKGDAAWVFFYSTSTACYKRIGGRVWYFHSSDCSREAIFNFTQTYGNLSNLQATDCSLFRLALVHHQYRSVAARILPGYPFILTPWQGPLQSWTTLSRDRHNTVNLTRMCSPTLSGLYSHSLPPASLSNLTLNPAPGEIFELNIDVVDELFNRKAVMLSVKVQSSSKSVLLGYNGIQLAISEPIFFSSLQPLWGVFLAGIPGSTGLLRITVVENSDMEQRKALEIPFRLRACHLGFDPPLIADKQEAREYVSNYSLKRLAQLNKHRMKTKGYIQDSRLVCLCKDYLPGVSQCSDGRTVAVRSDYWAGSRINNNIPEPHKKKQIEDLSEVEFQRKHRNVTDVSKDFVAVLCGNGMCSEHGNKLTWTLSQESPCRGSLHRTGILCGTCEEGTQRVVAELKCRNCEHSTTISLGLFIAVFFVIVSMIFAVLLWVNFGVSATLDSLLFFAQAAFLLSPAGIGVKSSYLLVLSFGLSMFCLEEDLTALQAKTLGLLLPVTSFFLIFVTWCISRFRRCLCLFQYLQRRKSLTHVLWLVILCSYSLMALSALSFLTCVRVGDELVLQRDGSVRCFKGMHIPYAVASILLLVVCIIPPPLLFTLRCVQSSTRLKELIDEATDIYEPAYRWWVSVNLLRRLALSTVVVFVVDIEMRNLAMVILLLVLAISHATLRPLRRDFQVWRIKDADNHYETMTLLVLVTLAIISLAASSERIESNPHNLKAALLPLQVILLVLGLVLSLLRHWYMSRANCDHGKRVSWKDVHDDSCESMVNDGSGQAELEQSETIWRKSKGSTPKWYYPMRSVSNSIKDKSSVQVLRQRLNQPSPVSCTEEKCGMCKPLLTDELQLSEEPPPN